MSKTVRCCPYCGSPSYVVRSPGKPSRSEAMSSYRCEAIGCRRLFDELDERETRSDADKSGNGHVHGLAKKLLDADPDEVRLS